MDINIFFDNGCLNKNKLREQWVQKNLGNFYLDLKNFQNLNNQNDLKFSQVIYNYLNNHEFTPKCCVCFDKDKRFIGFKEGYNDFCSKNCAVKYSLPQALEKRKSNTLEKWGVEHTSKLESVKEKQKNTNIQKYGFVSPTLNSDVKEKQINTMLNKYNVEYSGQNSLLLKKSLQTRFNLYKKNIYSLYQDLNIKNIPKEGELEILCTKCGREYLIRNSLLRLRYFRYKVEPCLNCNPISSYKFTTQRDIFDELSKYFSVEFGDRKILGGKELDIFIPEKKIAIEFNGIYWHSDLFKDKRYHINKKETCENKGVNLIHIWEDDWVYKKEIVLSRLYNLLGLGKIKIMARKCQIMEINHKDSSEFLENNHLQGNINSSIRYGLYFENELVSVMTFGKLRISTGNKSKSGTYELYRFASKLEYNVIGAFSKILKHFEREINPEEIVTYANRDWSIDNNVYEKNGFEFIHNTEPNFWYYDKQLKKQHRFTFRKSKMDNINLDEYLRIYDCGSKKYIKKLNR
jgi:hypothetical protein